MKKGTPNLDIKRVKNASQTIRALIDKRGAETPHQNVYVDLLKRSLGARKRGGIEYGHKFLRADN